MIGVNDRLYDGITERDVYDDDGLKLDDEADRLNDGDDLNELIEGTLREKPDRPNDDDEKDGLERIAEAPLRKPPQLRWKDEPRENDPPPNPDERPIREAAPA